MSRFKRFTRSIISGYLLLGANVVYTFASVPLVLVYLSKKEIGLWGVVTQIVGYLVWIDLGMAGSISRILIDHKDRPEEGTYGSIYQDGRACARRSGVIIAIAGAVVCLGLPGCSMCGGLSASIPDSHRGTLWNSRAPFVGRMFNHVLQAHQRYDAINYSQVGGLVLNLGVMWLGFGKGWGLYSLLAGYSASTVFTTLFTLAAAIRLKLLPSGSGWGSANARTFGELFAYGRENSADNSTFSHLHAARC